MNCEDHPQNKITVICIASHKCQRKLCAECQYEHGVEIKQLLPFKQFNENLQKRLQESKLFDKLELNKLRVSFKLLVCQTELIIKSFQEHLKNSIKKAFEEMDEEEQSYCNLVNQYINPTDISNRNLDKLIQIVQGHRLDEWNQKRTQQIINQEKAKNWLNQELKTLGLRFTAWMENVDSIIHNESTIQHEVCQQNEEIKELKGYNWDQNNHRFICTNYSIAFTNNQEIQYIKDQQIIRIDQIKDSSAQPEVLANLEQINYLYWSGNYGQNNQKIGTWKPIWKGEILEFAGGEYLIDGKKSGQWKEPIKNFWSLAQVYEVGQYQNSKRKGSWKLIYQDKQIGQGEYNQQGKKQGFWADISDNFFLYSQVIYSGEYNFHGMKSGRWDTFYCKYDEQEYTQIGGGSYQREGEIKIGKWIELDNNFYVDKQITYNGEYNLKGIKVGRWNIEYEGDLIGGGQYNLEEEQKKIGKWIELDENFYVDKQITYKGDYNLNGIKVGRWNIVYEGELIGGGSYDIEQGQKKIGKWVEIDEEFYNLKQVTYMGEYNLKGMKVGEWNIMYKWSNMLANLDEKYKQIGGGSYDKDSEKKVGRWVEIDEGFCSVKQVTYNGEYNVKGLKVGKWDIMYCFREKEGFKQIGGGSYDEQGVQSKIGDWVELDEQFQDLRQVTYYGQYNMKGIKIGKWLKRDLKLNDNFDK